MARAELMSAIGNLMMLLYMISRIDQPMLYEMAEKVPRTVGIMYEEVKASKKRKKVSIFELFSIMRSPEIYALLNAVRSMVKDISDK
ncbi:MAG: hypothetical protein ACK4FV_02885 [Candidatus Nitrosocaldus sp.]